MPGNEDGRLSGTSPPELSVVVLCYKAGRSSRNFVLHLQEVLGKAELDDYELVLVGNYHEGDADETPETVRALSAQDPRIRHVAMPKRGMMGWDMRSGLQAATGRYIAVIDGDGQMPVDDVLRVFREIKDGGWDLVLPYRVVRGDSAWRKLISIVYNAIFRCLFPGLGCRDVNAKPKIIRRDRFAQLDLRQDDWFLDAEIMIQARRLSFRVREIPTTFLGLCGRKSFVRLPAILEFVRNLFRFRCREFFR